MWPHLIPAGAGHPALIPTYLLCVGIGAIIVIIGLDREGERRGLDHRQVTRFSLAFAAAACAGWLGSIYLTRLIEGGGSGAGAVSALPGLLAGAAALALFMRGLSLPWSLFNVMLPYCVIGHGVGRIGCFLAGCCYGKVSSVPWAVTFPEGSFPVEAMGRAVPLHPVQVYEAVLLLGVGTALHRLPLHRRLPLYCVAYGSGRFLLEVLRADLRGDVPFAAGLSPAQCIGTMMFVAGWSVLWLQQRHVVAESSR